MSSPPDPVARAPQRWQTLGILVFLTGITLAAYQGVGRFDFVDYDDPKYISENPYVLAGLTWDGLKWAATSVFGPYWHPLTLLSHMADVQMFGLDAGKHHLVNLALHLANTLLLFLVLQRLTRAPGRSAVVAALFAVHPLHVESVAWVTERLDVLSTFFLLLTVRAYVLWVEHPTRLRMALVLGCYAGGLMSKPTLVTVPAVLLLLDLWPLGRIPSLAVLAARVREKVLLIALAAAGSAGTLIYEIRHGSVSGLDVLPLSERLANVCVWYVTYLGRTVWPARLAAFYPYPEHLPAWWVIGLSVTAIAGLSGLAIWSMRRFPYLFVGWFWFLVTLVPMIGLVQAADQATADRFTYIPLIGLFIVLSWGLNELLGRRPAGLIVLRTSAAAVIIACVLGTRVQAGVWRNTSALWTHATLVTTNNHRAQAGLGEALLNDGKPRDAIPHLLEAVRLAPRVATYHNDLGLAYARTQRLGEAITEYRNALRLQPDSPQARTNFGYALALTGQLDEAVAQHDRALALRPNFAEAHVNLASALLRQRRLDAAVVHIDTALQLDPRLAQAHAVHGAILQLQNRDVEAIAEYEAALERDSSLAQVHSNLGGALLKRGDSARAAREFTEALRLDPDLADAHNGLAVTLMGEGRTDDAIAHYREAVRLKPDSISAHSNLGVALAGRGDIAGATHEFSEVLRIDPANPQARAALKYLKIPREPV